MNNLSEGYGKLYSIIRHRRLDNDVNQVLNEYIEQCIICKNYMEEYRRIWTEEIVPSQKEKSNAWKVNPLLPAARNPYETPTLKVKLVTMKALM